MGNGIYGLRAKQNRDDYEAAKNKYADLANQQIKNVATGNNQLFGFNPWLSLQRKLAEGGVEGAETSLYKLDEAADYESNQAAREQARSSAWEKAIQDAEKYFTGLEAAKAQGPEAVVEFQKNNQFPKFEP
jgi:hypothetical protein